MSVKPATARIGRIALFTLVSGLLWVLAFEVSLALTARASTSVASMLGRAPEIDVPRWVADDVLGARPNPAYPGHDARGFRNPEAWDRVDIVVLGDSQTYGSGVAMNEAWPSRLRVATGRRVYSMAYPGYGPLQESLLLDEALRLEPRVVVATLYAGNDLFDAFRHVYGGDSVPGLRSADPTVVAAVADLEAVSPLLASAEASFRPPRRSPLRALAERTACYAVLRETRDAWVGDAWVTWLRRARREPARLRCFDRPGVRTVMTPAYRLTVLRLDDRRVEEGLRLSLEALEEMHATCAARGVELLVMQIPTKEYVYAELLPETDALGEAYATLVDQERELGSRVSSYLAAREIERFDARPALAAPLGHGQATYRESTDGHPSPRGHDAIAAALAERLLALGWVTPDGADAR